MAGMSGLPTSRRALSVPFGAVVVALAPMARRPWLAKKQILELRDSYSTC